MNKKTIDELQQKLIREKNSLEDQLKKFANKDEVMKGDWDTRFPKLDNNVSGSASLEAAASEVEEYSTLLPQEHSLELKLQNINQALEKIKKGTYGICERCGKEIPEERLAISPESKFCLDCGR
jgi:DnaK suppressor protein